MKKLYRIEVARTLIDEIHVLAEEDDDLGAEEVLALMAECEWITEASPQVDWGEAEDPRGQDVYDIQSKTWLPADAIAAVDP